MNSPAPASATIKAKAEVVTGRFAVKKSPVLSKPARFAVRTFAEIAKLLDVGADNETIVCTTGADWKAVIAARSVFTELVRTCPLSKAGKDQ